jgi:hypothetical protein
MIDWSKTIETWSGKPASVVWLDEAGMKTVEIECGRWSYNLDGTPIGHSYGPLRNAAANSSGDRK